MPEKSSKTQNQQHDESYKRFFSHPTMVRQLLEAFLEGPWLESLDLDSLERVPGSFVSPDYKERHNDVIWKLRSRKNGQWIYIYLLIEFQSQPDRFMAIRLLIYVALLYELLSHQDEYRSGEVLLPVVLPLVVYNGRPRWLEPRALADLLEPAPEGFAAYQPQLSYLLIDEGSFSEEELRAKDNVVATLFRLENVRRSAEIRERLLELNTQLLELGQPEIEETFDVWLERVMRLRFPSLDFGQIRGREGRAMLSEAIKEWIDESHQSGLTEGRQAGLTEGRQAGLTEGRQAGLEEGIDVIRSLLLEQMAQRFGDSEDDIRKVRALRDMRELRELGRKILACNSREELWQ